MCDVGRLRKWGREPRDLMIRPHTGGSWCNIPSHLFANENAARMRVRMPTRKKNESRTLRPQPHKVAHRMRKILPIARQAVPAAIASDAVALCRAVMRDAVCSCAEKSSTPMGTRPALPT